MKKISLENGKCYLEVMKYIYNEKTYLYLINEELNTNIEIMEQLDNNTLIMITDKDLLRKIISGMVSDIYKFFD